MSDATDPTAGPGLDPALALATEAATAAAAVLPAAEPLAAVGAQPGTEHVTAAFAGAAIATVEGTLSGGAGRVAVLVGADLVEALASSPLGGLDLAAATQPALDAAAAALGGSATAAQQVDLSLVLADLGAPFTAVPLVGSGIAAALLVTDTLLPGAPAADVPVVAAGVPVVDATGAEVAAGRPVVDATAAQVAAGQPVVDAAAPVTAGQPVAPAAAYAPPVAQPAAQPVAPQPAMAGVGGYAGNAPVQAVHHAPGSGGGLVPRRGIEMLHGVDMEVTVELGRTRMTVRDLLALAPGAVLELDRAAGSPADLLVNGRLIARGEVVVVDEDFGLRITEILDDSVGG
ncbi:flagellar motor switch protein FliN [Nocardioides perillae]|uniref:Flagellar motor switch protein FliN/FliY n=1 Tax=Nocardioides perillae TaxID=1119534 RepID=A0A7Y9RYF8_9ACTN|nr:flagellar motor switch protein FliN [Nocardioides perillae]NYG57047.1 flagellar motor switch protein FliN/FliY [Nocardioides perillae]